MSLQSRAEGNIVACYDERKVSKWQFQGFEDLEAVETFETLKRALRISRPLPAVSICGNHVEMLWDVQVDRVWRGRYV